MSDDQSEVLPGNNHITIGIDIAAPLTDRHVPGGINCQGCLPINHGYDRLAVVDIATLRILNSECAVGIRQHIRPEFLRQRTVEWVRSARF